MTKGKLSTLLIAGGLATCFSFFTQLVFCQTLQTFTGKKDILIGEQIKIDVKATYDPAEHKVRSWLSMPDSIPHFEIIEKSKIDTVKGSNNTQILSQAIIITSFDSGRWAFPALSLNFDPLQDDTTYNRFTDSFTVNVSYAPADSTNQLRDIKPIIKVSAFDFFWLYMAAGILLLLLIIFLLYRYFKKKETPATQVSKLSPFDEAMAELKNLSKYNLQDAAEIKLYHIKLAAIFKNYLGRKQGKNLFNKTTGDLLISMKEINLPPGNIPELATALRCTDAVKFAKYLPLPEQSEDCLQKIKETINLTEQKTQNP